MSRSFGFAIALVGLCGTPALAGQGACPFGTSYADGCTHAPKDGNFINSNFFTYARQSGQQGYYDANGKASGHPPPWNVAGVDYPVGYSGPRRLKDPATDPLPSGCTYSATGSNNGGAIVICGHVADLVLDHWDFSLHNCTVLDIKNDTSEKIKIKDSRFVNGSNCSRSGGYLVEVENPASSNFVFAHNFVDGDALHYPSSLTGMVVANNTGTVTFKYNAFLHSPARPIVSGSHGSLLIAYNYWEGFIYSKTDGHGEVMINAFGTATQPSATYSFNTVLEPNNVMADNGTAAFYLSNGQSGGTILQGQVDHNTSIINLNNGNVTVSAASAETSYDTYGSVLFDENYMDPTGAYLCFVSTGNETFQSSPVFTGNVNMINGRAVNGYNYCP